MQLELTKIDIKILQLLQENLGLSTVEIAERAGLSQSPCWRRINRLEQVGIIKHKVAVLDRVKLDMEVVVFVNVSLTAHGRQNLEDFEKEIITFPEVLECYTISGEMDYLLKIVTKDIQRYESFLRNHLMMMPMIREMHSTIAVTEIKDTTKLPLDTQL